MCSSTTRRGNPGWMPFHEHLAAHSLTVPDIPGTASRSGRSGREPRDLAILLNQALDSSVVGLSLVGLGFRLRGRRDGDHE
jgi:hypothetical protein